MKSKIQDGKLFLTAENEGDQSILLEIWLHPLITGIFIPHFRYGVKDARAELICSEPKKKRYPE